MAEAHCPASCGELLQGWILGGEKLVSCPINWFSYVSVTEDVPLGLERPRMRQMLERVLKHLDIVPEATGMLRIEYDSTIPVGKGLASSTADIAATAQATARFYGHELSPETLAALCVSVEPTDSTFFSSLTLFDHQTAGTQISLGWAPDLKILLLESPDIVLTEDFHKRDRRAALLARETQLEQAWQYLSTACEQQSPQRLGEAATLSAIASQDLLPKHGFNELLELAEQNKIYGLNVAHSGSVIGLIYDDTQHDKDFIYDWIQHHQLDKFYPQVHEVCMTPGGVR
ncbi:GHMP kinase [Morganella psychrotolerans]|uniref:GHMP kinase n=1 Tax=Morganella psychrotolerans TaxID=368603 RepID=A0A1B8HAR0_9GAMM|nr:GHMP kinase [Morganella psychrotolerans]OBU06153.1 GHMP kinase [Morganella psychrotolerans]